MVDRVDESSLDDFQRIDLDINSLKEKFIDPIDRYRSRTFPQVLGNLKQDLIIDQSPKESRCHAFYRMLGLPVIDQNGRFYNPGFNPLISSKVGKTREDIARSIPTSVKQIIQKRESLAKRNSDIFANQSYLCSLYTLVLSTPFSVRNFFTSPKTSVSTLEQGDPQTEKLSDRRAFISSNFRRRSGEDVTNLQTFDSVQHILFPMITDPVIAENVEPKSGNSVLVAAPFLNHDDTEYERNNYLKRPGIEFILRLRLRQQVLLEDSDPTLGALGEEENFIEDITDSKRLSSLTLDNLVKTLKGVVSIYFENVKTVAESHKKIAWVPFSNAGGPESGSDRNILFIAPKRFLDSWEIDRSILYLEQRLSFAKQQVDLGETSDNTPLNFGSFTISEFQNVSKLFSDDLQKKNNEFEEIETKASNALRVMEIISGEVSGFGLIDVLAVYIALWSVNISVLLDLIDDQAVERLEKNADLRSQEVVDRGLRRGNAKEAHDTLVNRVRAILSFADLIYQKERGSLITEEGGDVIRDSF
jgi:hypothetical protein